MELNQKFNWQNIQGYFDSHELYDRFIRESQNLDKFIDLNGCLKSIGYLATRSKLSNKKLEIITINTQNENFLENTTKLGVYDFVSWMRVDKISGANYFKKNSLFAVFINENYDYETTFQLVKTWLPKIKKNGYIAGSNILIPSVKKAIELLLPDYEQTNCIYPIWFKQV